MKREHAIHLQNLIDALANFKDNAQKLKEKGYEIDEDLRKAYNLCAEAAQHMINHYNKITTK